jgi:hypothetical protein
MFPDGDQAMSSRRSFWRSLAGLPLLTALGRPTRAETPEPADSPAGKPGMQMLTIFLRHDESKTVDEINQHLRQTGWFRDFPPPGVEVLSWYVMMGIGQVVTIRFPAERLREINRLVEGEAWGGYRTEFYPTYDYRALYAQLQAKMR